jgi:hypothetical protein
MLARITQYKLAQVSCGSWSTESERCKGNFHQPQSVIMQLQVNQANFQFNNAIPSILTSPLLSAVIQHTQTRILQFNITQGRNMKHCKCQPGRAGGRTGDVSSEML